MFDIEKISKTKGLTIKECEKKAEKYINKNGMCLFLLDVKGSRNFQPRQELQEILTKVMEELNKEFDEYFPENYLATLTRKEKGFCFLLGDAMWAGINKSEVIIKISNYLDKNYPKISFYLGIAEDGWDEEGLKTIK